MNKRVVSLIPSSTEIVHALGLGDWLVGRSHECDYPASVIDLPAVTESKFDPDGTSYEIDQRVKAILQESLAVYRVFVAELEALQPDVIITQSQCDVCAVSLKDVEAAVLKMVSSNPQIVALEPHGLADIWKDIQTVADALGETANGESLVSELKARIDDIDRQTLNLETKPTVACIEWIEPMMSAGNWVPTLVDLAGGINLFGTPGEHSPWLQWSEVVARDPDIIVMMPCGWDIAKTRSEMDALVKQPEWAALKAVQADRVYLTDGNQYFNRPGPRLVESAEILAEIFHPDLFDFGHERSGWERYQ